MVNKEAMKLALDALEECASIVDHHTIGCDAENAVANAHKVIALLKAFAEQPAQQEPVAFDVIIEDEEALAALRDTVVQSDGDLTAIRLLVGNGHAGYGLYVSVAEYQEEGAFLLAHASPPAQRTWVGLIRGVRVEGDTVVIAVKGGNDAARELCGALLEEKNT